MAYSVHLNDLDNLLGKRSMKGSYVHIRRVFAIKRNADKCVMYVRVDQATDRAH